MTVIPSTVRELYDLSTRHGPFLDLLPELDCRVLADIIDTEIKAPPLGRLRTLEELRGRDDSRHPGEDVGIGPDRLKERTLQSMFMRREYLAASNEIILYRELPSRCAREREGGWADLLAYDVLDRQAIIVELKHSEAGDLLTGAVLEALTHWAFNVRHWEGEGFAKLLTSWGYPSLDRLNLRIVIAAPETYFRETLRRNDSKRRNNEVCRALAWVNCLRAAKVVDIRIFQIADNWAAGPDFTMTPWDPFGSTGRESI